MADDVCMEEYSRSILRSRGLLIKCDTCDEDVLRVSEEKPNVLICACNVLGECQRIVLPENWKVA